MLSFYLILNLIVIFIFTYFFCIFILFLLLYIGKELSLGDISLMSRKLNFDVNVDGRTDGRTEIWTPISHPAISRCDKNNAKQVLTVFLIRMCKLYQKDHRSLYSTGRFEPQSEKNRSSHRVSKPALTQTDLCSYIRKLLS